MSSESGRKTVVVVGGGYAGFAVAKELDASVDVTLVEPRDAFVHNVAALRALVEPEWLERIFLPYERLLENGRVVRARAVEVDDGRVLLGSGEELHPDVIVLATGSTYPFPAKTGTDETETAVGLYRAAHDALEPAARVLIVGAGPTGLELAGEISHRWPEKAITVVEAAPDVLTGPYQQELRDEVRRQLEERGVRLVLGEALTAEPDIPPVTPGDVAVTTVGGTAIEANIWFRAYGLAPVSDYLTGELAAARRPDGAIEVAPTLQVQGHPTVFAVGDVAAADIKSAGRAGRQAAVVAENVEAFLEGRELRPYEPSPPALLIPLGPTAGASQLPGREGIAGAEETAAMKGADMFVDRYREQFGLEQPAVAS